MDRIPGLTRDYTASLDRLGVVSGSRVAKALGRVARELLTADVLPMSDDVEAPLPRIVEGLAGDELEIVAQRGEVAAQSRYLSIIK